MWHQLYARQHPMLMQYKQQDNKMQLVVHKYPECRTTFSDGVLMGKSGKISDFAV